MVEATEKTGVELVQETYDGLKKSFMTHKTKAYKWRIEQLNGLMRGIG